MDLKDKIKVMQHFAEGGKIEYSRTYSELWKETSNPIWDWALYAYRIQPPKTKQPLTAADFPPGTLLRCHKEFPNIPWIQYALNENGIIVWWPNEVTKHWTWNTLTILYLERSLDQGKTWLPCYKEV